MLNITVDLAVTPESGVSESSVVIQPQLDRTICWLIVTKELAESPNKFVRKNFFAAFCIVLLTVISLVPSLLELHELELHELHL